MLRFLVAALALTVGTLTVRAADEEHPYKNAKVGDYATYAMSMKFGPVAVKGTLTQTVIEKTDKQVVVEATGSVDFNGKEMALPAQKQTIDLTKPFDPTKVANLPAGADAKVEKVKSGEEKIKVGGKEYATTWTIYNVKAKAMNREINAEVKTWMAKDVPGGLVKVTMSVEAGGQKMEALQMELKETGNKK